MGAAGADRARHAGVARALLLDGRVPREGDVVRDPELADGIERLAPDGAGAVLHAATSARAVSDWVLARGGTLTRADLAAYATVAREPVRVRYHGREVLTNPPPSAGGLLIAYALALLERGAGPARRGRSSSTRWRPRRPSARRRSSRASHEPGFLETFMALAPRLDDARLGARRRRLGLRGHDHQRRGLGDRRPRHRHPRQQHDGRAGPLARGLVHPPARAPAAVDDGADGRARRRARRSSCSARPARTGSARRSCR